MNNFFERRYIIAGIFITIFLVLLARLFYIQIVDDKYEFYANRQAIHKSIVYAARGPIFDRNGHSLVENELLYDININPHEVKPFDTVEFCRLIEMDTAEFKKRFAKAKRLYPNTESPFDKQLSPDLYATLQERLSEFPGFTVQQHPVRTYPDSAAAQFLGYISEATPADIERSGGYYKLGDYIGAAGVEKAYENVLRGQRGVKMQMVDSRGNARGLYANGEFDTVAVAGERLTSSLDLDIQKLGEQLMHNKVGSIVAIDPNTGEILAFVSSPTYNPNLMVGHERGNNIAALLANPYDPLVVRPIQAYYPPGSSFKPLSALIALQEGIITPETTYNCPGYYISGNRKVKCFNGERHGVVNLRSAVAESCNGFFFMVFDKLINAAGVKKTAYSFTEWRDKVLKFGLSQRLGLDFPGERPGRIYSAKNYDQVYKPGGWRSSTILSDAIGQGEVDATPLQLANIEATIANHGYYYTPHLIKSIGNRNITRPEDTVKHYVGVSPQYFEPVINGMQDVVDHGTAAASKIPGIVMCGKTGTADNSHGKPNSVFVAFAPRENPKIAIAVIVENAGQGASYAAPIASFVVEKYLTRKISPRPTGIDPTQYMNANMLPDPALYLRGKKTKRDTTKKSAPKPAVESAMLPNKKTITPKPAA
jgi:penicillin-binding protein 2